MVAAQAAQEAYGALRPLQLHDLALYPSPEGLPLHGAAIGRCEHAGIGCTPTDVIFIEGGLIDAPLHKKLLAAIVLNNTQGGF